MVQARGPRQDSSGILTSRVTDAVKNELRLEIPAKEIAAHVTSASDGAVTDKDI